MITDYNHIKLIKIIYKMKGLLLLSLLVLAATKLPNEKNDIPRSIICPSDKAKVDDICTYQKTKDNNPITLYFNNASKNKRCRSGTLTKEHKLREPGQSCNYHHDCTTGICFDGDCLASGFGGRCSSSLDCLPGLGCDGSNCQKLLKKDAKTKYDGQETKGICGFGLSNHEDKCKAWGSIKYGENTSDKKLCESGYANNGKCDEITSVAKCEENKSAEVVFKSGAKTQCTCKLAYDVDEKKVFFCNGYSKFRTDLWKSYVEELENKNKNDKLYDKKPNVFANSGILSYGDYTLSKKYILYEYGEQLVATGIAGEDGKIKKSCEFDYVVDQLSGNYLKSILLIILGFTLLLF